jgi:hypothetical protein
MNKLRSDPRTLADLHSFRSTALPVLWAIAAVVPFLVILYFGLPAWFPGWITQDATSVVLDKVPGQQYFRQLWVIFVALATVGLMQGRGWVGRFLPLAVLLATLAIGQAWIWQSGLSKYVMVGGLVPFADATVYSQYANQIFQNHQIVDSLQDRPMFAALLGTLWWLCGGNPQIALWPLLLICGLAMYLATRAVRVWFGSVAAVTFLSIVYFYYARWLGTLMTEQLGLALGLLACPLLLGGFMQKRERAWLAGVTLLALALCTRAGAFFVLPALCVVAAIHFGQRPRFAWKLAGKTLGLVIVAMALSRFLAFCVFDADHFPRSNFGFTAYGVVNYGDWTLALKQFGTDRDKIQAALFERIKTTPSSVPIGMWLAWKAFFSNSIGFSFMGAGYAAVLQIITIGTFLMACFRRIPASPLVIAFCIGMGASIPFVPPADADRMRAYAATIPLQALVAGLGVSGICQLLQFAARRFVAKAEVPKPEIVDVGSEMRVCASFGVALLTLIFVIPITRYVYFPNRVPAQTIMALSKRPQTIPSGFYINLIADSAPQTWVPNVRVSDFRRNLASLGAAFRAEAAALAQLPEGVSVVGGGIELIILPSEKLHRADSTAKFNKVRVNWIRLAIDTELAIPIAEVPAPY